MGQATAEVDTPASKQSQLEVETDEGWTYHPHAGGNGGYWSRPVSPEIVAQMPVLQENLGLIEKTKQWLRPLS